MSKLRQWLSAHKREIFFFVILFFVSTISFSFGYLLARKEGKVPIIIEQNSRAMNF
jgi:hypothetical protein